MKKNILHTPFTFVPLIDSKGLRVSLKPELPKVEYKIGKDTYTVTALKYLNASAVNLFFQLLIEAVELKAFDGVTYSVPDDMDIEELEVMLDIVSSIQYEWKRRRIGSATGLILVGGYALNYDNGKIKSVTFEFLPNHAKYIYEYLNEEHEPIEVKGNDNSYLQKLLLLTAIAVHKGITSI